MLTWIWLGMGPRGEEAVQDGPPTTRNGGATAFTPQLARGRRVASLGGR